MSDRIDDLLYEYVKCLSAERDRLTSALEAAAAGAPITPEDRIAITERADQIAAEKMRPTMTADEWNAVRTRLTRAESRARSQRANGRTIPHGDGRRSRRNRA